MLGRVLCGVFATLIACTAIRPLEAPETLDAGARDAARSDASVDAPGPDTNSDAARLDASADAARPDSSGDGGCDPGAAELCNGRDDDCSPATEDGSGDPALGTACDGPDLDLCPDGVFTGCSAGALTCNDAAASTPEVCGGGDEDCDGMVDEATAVGASSYYRDADGDGFGSSMGAVTRCAAPTVGGPWVTLGGDCNDANLAVSPRAAEVCNAMDDNCDGLVDEDATCAGCDTAVYMGHTYLFCISRLPMAAAAMACMTAGYHLVQIEDAAENDFLAAAGMMLGTDRGFWIGLTQPTPGVPTYVWPDRSVATYLNWEPLEPSASGQCVRLRPLSAGQWGDYLCTSNASYVCEAP